MSAPHPLSRRALLFGRSADVPGPIRPPWAKSAALFRDACTRCDACVRQCPANLLKRGDDGLPYFDAQAGECNFCGECAAACAHAAFDIAQDPPWPWRAVVGDACLSARGVVCASCRDTCPENAVRLAPGGRGGARVDASRCTGCAACVAACPADAIALSAHALEAAA